MQQDLKIQKARFFWLLGSSWPLASHAEKRKHRHTHCGSRFSQKWSRQTWNLLKPSSHVWRKPTGETQSVRNHEGNPQRFGGRGGLAFANVLCRRWGRRKCVPCTGPLREQCHVSYLRWVIIGWKGVCSGDRGVVVVSSRAGETRESVWPGGDHTLGVDILNLKVFGKLRNSSLDPPPPPTPETDIRNEKGLST